MNHSDSKTILLITDFDGTVYHGLCPYLSRGIANVDLALALSLLNIFKIRRFFRLINGILQLGRIEKRLRSEYVLGKINLSEADEQLVRFFASNVLAHCESKDIERAACMISRLCYRDAWRSFVILKENCEYAIVSKSFEFLLAEVIRRASDGYGLKIEYHGIKSGSGLSVIQKDSVVRKEDKYSRVKALLGCGNFKKAIVIGDTEDDIAMRDACVELLEKSNVLFISMNAKDHKIAGTADKSFRSWKSLGLFLEEQIAAECFSPGNSKI